MNVLFSISAYVFFVALAIKVILHIQLDISNGYKLAGNPSSTWVYFMPYDKEVASEFYIKKTKCNKIHKWVIYLFVVMFIMLILKTIFSNE